MAIDVVVTGALGKMGITIMKAIYDHSNTNLVGAVDVKEGDSIGEIIGAKLDLSVESDLKKVLRETKPRVLVDFTRADAAFNNALVALENGIHPVIGTTGLTDSNIEHLHVLCEEKQLGAIVSPNFALGTVLMMRFAEEAAKYFNSVEIIELHHNNKIDAPSGTAIATAKKIGSSLSNSAKETTNQPHNLLGTVIKGVPIHSVRLPGLVAQHEVMFGGKGETLTIRHDSISRESFHAGLILAVEKVIDLRRLVIGLENLL